MREVTLASINCDLILLANSSPSPMAILQSLHKIPQVIKNRHLKTVQVRCAMDVKEMEQNNIEGNDSFELSK